MIRILKYFVMIILVLGTVVYAQSRSSSRSSSVSRSSSSSSNATPRQSNRVSGGGWGGSTIKVAPRSVPRQTYTPTPRISKPATYVAPKSNAVKTPITLSKPVKKPATITISKVPTKVETKTVVSTPSPQSFRSRKATTTYIYYHEGYYYDRPYVISNTSYVRTYPPNNANQQALQRNYVFLYVFIGCLLVGIVLIAWLRRNKV